jgi:hypothetical protein
MAFHSVIYKRKLGQVHSFFVHKNWPLNPWTSCLKPIDFASKCEVEYNLIAKLEIEFQDEVDHEDFLNLNFTF